MELFKKPVVQKVPELYSENLKTLSKLMDMVPALGSIDGVFEVEIRVRVDDVNTWAVLGYGESGEPCILRFETEEIVSPPKPITRSVPPYTINTSKLAEKGPTCSCGDWSYGGKQGTCGPNGCYNRPA